MDGGRKMTDDLRTRISAIAGEHRFADHQTAFGDKCVCGWTSQGIAHSDHLADAVIRELGLREELRYPGRFSFMPPQRRRYVTEWETE